MRQPTPEDEARRQAAYDAANARWPSPLSHSENARAEKPLGSPRRGGKPPALPTHRKTPQGP
jgi:hypothetical protein